MTGDPGFDVLFESAIPDRFHTEGGWELAKSSGSNLPGEAHLHRDETVRHAVFEIDAYLSRFGGPGIAEVRSGIADWGQGPIKAVPRKALPACDHLDAALEALRATGEASLATAIALVNPHLRWAAYDAYPSAEIGETFAGAHAFASLIGEGSFIGAGDFDLGLFIIAPNVFYRDHHHAAPELYAPLTGPHGWRFRPGDPLIWKAAHEPVWNEPWQTHATMTGLLPFLCIFAWTRDVRIPAKVVASPDWGEFEGCNRTC